MADILPGGAPGEFVVRDGDRVSRVWAVASGGVTWVFYDGVTYEIGEESTTRGRGGAAPGSLTSPMPATVIQVKVAAGDTVRRGDILIVLEAMKMELPVRAPADGRITAVHCEAGQLVQPDTSLIDFAPPERPGAVDAGGGAG